MLTLERLSTSWNKFLEDELVGQNICLYYHFITFPYQKFY